MKIITIGTLKGGTGKSSTLFNLAGILAENKKVLLIDADPQCNLSLDVGVDVTRENIKTIKDIFERSARAKNLIHKSPMPFLPNLDIIPSSIQLTATELNIVSMAGREQILSNFVLDNQELLGEYDYILIDTNPSMSIINQNAFLVANNIILVSDISLNGIQGAELFIALWESARKQLRKANNISALLINNFDKRIKLSGELLEYCKENEGIKDLLLETVIPSSVKVKETELEHKPINILQNNSSVHEAFRGVISELKVKEIL